MLAVNLSLAMLAGVSARMGRPFGVSLAPGLYVLWLMMAGCGAALLPLVALAFERFDVGRDTPP